MLDTEAFAITLNINAVCLSPSDQVLDPLLVAAHQDGRSQLNISGSELTVSTSTRMYDLQNSGYQTCAWYFMKLPQLKHLLFRQVAHKA